LLRFADLTKGNESVYISAKNKGVTLMPRPRKDFNQLMLDYNRRFGKTYFNVDWWLLDLQLRLSVRAIARLIKVDRTVLTRKLKELI